MMKDIGDVQCVKQTSFVRVTCQMPAATRVTAEANTNGPVMAPMRPDAINANRAATPNPPQTRKYGVMKRAVAASSAGFVGRPASRRVIPRYAKIMGRDRFHHAIIGRGHGDMNVRSQSDRNPRCTV